MSRAKTTTPPTTNPALLLQQRYNWKQVVAPKMWRPTHAGDELVGFYGGKSQRQGAFGAYDVIIVHVPQRGALLVSGTQALQLVDASGIAPGAPVRIVYQGTMPLAGDRSIKCFDLFIPDDQQPLAAEHLPQVRDH